MSRMSDNPQGDIFRKVVYPSVTDGIINQILNAIKTDRIIPGEKLPSEPDLSKQMGVSRNALREALKTLIEKGVLFRERGIGTFVTPQSVVMLKTNLSNAIGTSKLIANQKKKPGQSDFSFKFMDPPKIIAEHLQISETEQVMLISRVRTADGLPIIVSKEYIPGNIPGLDYKFEQYASYDNWSIYDHFQRANYTIQSVITQFHAISSDIETSKKLKIKALAPLICLEQTHFCYEYMKPILFAINIHNDRMINIMMVRSI